MTGAGQHGDDAAIDLVVVAAVNNDRILTLNLQRSPLIDRAGVALHCYRGFHSAGAAYNAGLDGTDSEIVVFAHQDVFLPAGWQAALARGLRQLEARDPHWAVLGACGLDAQRRFVGHVWSSGLGRLLGGHFDEPVEVSCVDELLFIVRRASGLRFDQDLPGFHLYGTDIVLLARAAGLRAYVADIPVIHNSRPVRRLGPDYVRAYRYMQRKWRPLLPAPTLIVPLVQGFFPLLRAWVRLRLSWKRRSARAVDPATDPVQIARRLGLE